jgi:hypothetical protein
MNPKSTVGTILIVVIGVLVFGARFHMAQKRAEQNAVLEAKSYDEHKEKMRAILANVGKNPKLREAAKDVKAEAKYIEEVFDEIHDEAWEAAASHGLRSSFTVDEYAYMDGFFKLLSARALKDKKNELSGAIDRVNLYTQKVDISDWKPLDGSSKARRP